MMLFSCSAAPPAHLGLHEGTFAPCPASPNCVNSDARDAPHGLPAFSLRQPPEHAWREVVAVVTGLPRVKIVTHTGEYLHAECTSAVFRFVDDLELHLRPAAGIIAVRSASRLGYSDLGVNRRRVESLRKRLMDAGVIR